MFCPTKNKCDLTSERNSSLCSTECMVGSHDNRMLYRCRCRCASSHHTQSHTHMRKAWTRASHTSHQQRNVCVSVVLMWCSLLVYTRKSTIWEEKRSGRERAERLWLYYMNMMGSMCGYELYNKNVGMPCVFLSAYCKSSSEHKFSVSCMRVRRTAERRWLRTTQFIYSTATIENVC